MIKLLISALLFFAYNEQAFARPIIADLSLRTIEIDSGFKGTEILLFGARVDAGDIVVVVRGPENDYVVRKKERLAGVWVNQKQAVFEDASGFYTAASNRRLDEIKNDSMLKSLSIGIHNIKFTHDSDSQDYAPEFEKAFLEKKQQQNLYNPIVEDVIFIGDTLFRTIIKFPDNIPRGTYTAEAYLFSDGQLVGMQSTPISVYKKGFDAFVFDLAYDYPTLYGLAAVMIALGAGWVAGAIFRRV